MKAELSYTPEAETVQAVYERIAAFRKAYEQGDDYYAGHGDKVDAIEGLEKLIELAIARFAGIDAPADKTWGQWVYIAEKLLTYEELSEAREYQKMINGSSYEEPNYDQRKSGATELISSSHDVG